MTPSPVVSACWAIFLLFWLIAARWTKPVAARRSGFERVGYWIVLLIGFGFLFNQGGFSGNRPLGDVIVPGTLGFQLLADAIAIAGVATAIWARVTLGANWSGSVQVKQGHELVTSGPYRYVRHPIYTALLLMYLGTAASIGTLGAFLGFPLVLLSCRIKLKQEEDFMLRTFPAEYPEYMQRVKRLVPFVV
jgi:protein-S-isoprenylcysteine O-methyltransferase Ste14